MLAQQFDKRIDRSDQLLLVPARIAEQKSGLRPRRSNIAVKVAGERYPRSPATLADLHVRTFCRNSPDQPDGQMHARLLRQDFEEIIGLAVE